MTETIAELVEREALEAEQDDETPGLEPDEPATEPETETTEHEARVTEAEQKIDLAEREKKLRQEDGRHENALKRIYGDEFAEHAYCPLCLGQGFLTPIPAGGQPDEVWDAIVALSGRTPAATYEHPGELVTCDRCRGHGQVATGALNEHNAVIPCQRCDGRGYFNTEDPVHRGRLGLAPPAPAPAPLPTFAPYQPPASVANGASLDPPAGWYAAGKIGADPWDRWPGHPRYGIDPETGGW